MSEDIAGAVQELLDERAIRELLHAFVHGLDGKDWDGYAATFAPDGTFEIMGQRRTGREEIAAGPARDLARFDRLQHFLTNVVIRVDGDDATAQAYLLGVHVPEAADTSTHADIGARYRYRCRRTDEGWRFASVKLEIVWSGGLSFVIQPATSAG
jgi:uncharacterized protein (TIGR02246 family)